MHPRPLTSFALAGALSFALSLAACGSDPEGAPGDGSAERPTASPGGSNMGATDAGAGGGSGTARDTRPPPDAPPASPNPAAIKILPARTDLLGSFQNGCTSGPGAERWCAVSRPVSLARRELWFVNVTRAAAMASGPSLLSACDVPGLCVKATDQLYTARPEEGPAYPEGAARASGNTFIYLSDPVSSAVDPFQGDVWVHTVGSASATKIGEDVFDCAVAGQRAVGTAAQRSISKVVGLCAGDPSSAPGEEPIYFTMMAGVVAGQQGAAAAQPAALPLAATPGLLPTLQKIYPVHPTTGASRYRVGFSPDGGHLVLSHAGPTVAEVEKLTTIRSDDLGKPGLAPVQLPGTDGATRWSLSAEGKKVFFLKGYNYNVGGNQAGTLAVADFPGGENARELAGSRVPSGPMTGVGAIRPLVSAAGVDSGLGFIAGLAMGRGDYSIIKDPAGSMDDPANVVSVAMRTASLPVPSPDLRFSLFVRSVPMGSPELWLAANDGSMECPVTSGAPAALTGPLFSRSAGLMFWADNFDETTLSAEGWLTDPADCRNQGKKRLWSRNVDFWFVDGDRLLLYSEDLEGEQVSIKYAFIQGNTLGEPVTIQTRASRDYRIVLDAQPADGSPPRWKGILYTLGGSGEATDGVYYYELPAAGGP